MTSSMPPICLLVLLENLGLNKNCIKLVLSILPKKKSAVHVV